MFSLVKCLLGLLGWDGMGWDGVGWEVGGKFKRGDICIPMADSCGCMAETNTIL